MKRRLLSLFVAFAMTISMVVVGAGAVEPTYGDTAGHWAESAIDRWSGHSVVQGSNGEFDPNGPLTCAQLATILAKLLKLPNAANAGFTDVAAGAWYADAINRCAAAGILNGNGDGTVDPNGAISRERAMVMLGRALGIQPLENPDLTKFSDAAKVASYAQGMVAALIEKGVVGGVTSDTLAPQDDINRASTVTILDRAIRAYGDKTGGVIKVEGTGIVIVVADDVTITGDVEQVIIPADNVGVTIRGCENIDSITVTGENSKVILENSSANDVTLDSKNTEIETKGNSKVDTVNVSEDAAGATVNAGSGTTIGSVENKAENTTVTGSGAVKEVTSDKDMTVETKDTEVKNTGDEKISVTDKDGKTSETTAGGSSTTGDSTGGTTGGSTGGSSGGGSSHSHTFADEWTSDDTYHWHAATCGHSEVSGKAEHTVVTISGDEPSCSMEGHTESKHCPTCGKVFVEQEVIPRLPHTEEVIPEVAATCTATGLTEGKKCSVCGAITVAQREISKLPHTEEVIPEVAATCTDTGLTEGKKCSACGEILVPQDVTPAKGHTWDVGYVYTPATELMDGEITYECSDCHATKVEPITKTGEHTVTHHDAVAPNCSTEKPGNAEYWSCTGCGKKFSDARALDIYEITEDTAIFIPWAHTEVTDDAVEATCTTTGWTEGKHCSACNKVLTAQVETPKKDHEFNDNLKCETCGEYKETVVATIGEKGYASLIAAYNDLPRNTEKNAPTTTITLTKDCAGGGFGSDADVGMKYIIDFAGYTYTVGEPAVGSQGTVTQGVRVQKGSTAEFKNGTLKAANYDKLKQVVHTYGTVTFTDFTVDATEDSYAAIAVEADCGKLNINGSSSILAYDGQIGLYVAFWHTKDYNGTNVVVDTTGKITGKLVYEFDEDCADTPATSNRGYLTIKNGIFEISKIETRFTDVTDGSLREAKITISGGTFTVDPSAYVNSQYVVTMNGGVWSMLEVAENAKTGDRYTSLATAITRAQSGDTIKLIADTKTPKKGYSVSKEITLDLNGKTLTGSGEDGVIHPTGKGIVTITGEGKIVAVEEQGYAMAIWASGASKAIIDGGEFTQEISGSDDHYDLIYASGSAAIEINGGVFESKTPKWTLNILDKDYTAGRASITVTGGRFCEYDPASSKTETTAANFVKDGYKVESATQDSKTYYTVTKPIAEINGKKFATLADAINAAKDGETVKLLDDATGQGLGSADDSENPGNRGSITIDFGKHTYTMTHPAVGSAGTESQAMHWGTSLRAVTLQNGKFCVAKDAAKMAMQNYITFTADGMTFDFTEIPVQHYGTFTGKFADFSGKEVPMFNHNGSADVSMTLKDCEVTLPQGSNYGGAVSGNLKLENTKFSGYLCFVDAGTITMDGGSEIGGPTDYFPEKLDVVCQKDAERGGATWTATAKTTTTT